MQRTVAQCKSKTDRKVRKHFRNKTIRGEIPTRMSIEEFRDSYVTEIESDDDNVLGFDSSDDDEDEED